MLQKPFCPNQSLSQGPLSKQMMKRRRSLATPCRQGQRSATAMCRSCTRKHRALSNTGEGFKQRPKNCDYSPAHEKQTKEKKSKAPAPEKRGGEAKQASPPNLAIPRENFPVGGTTRVQAPQPPMVHNEGYGFMDPWICCWSCCQSCCWSCCWCCCFCCYSMYSLCNYGRPVGLYDHWCRCLQAQVVPMK